MSINNLKVLCCTVAAFGLTNTDTVQYARSIYGWFLCKHIDRRLGIVAQNAQGFHGRLMSWPYIILIMPNAHQRS